ncbi:MAG: DUF1707 domain-containing protein [Sciscionella sp.]|nr:DUF1707 domain-containing protein [Sciscionella sp.]
MDQRDIRVSDTDRQAAADRLRVAHDEGRLTLAEYDERVASAYAAVTYGDLAELFVDLPDQPAMAPHAPASTPAPTSASPAPSVRAPQMRPTAVSPGGFASLPGALRAAWSVWFVAVSINLVIWLLVSIGNGDLEYFWPMWVAGPWGAVLFASSAATLAGRRGRQLDMPGGREEISDGRRQDRRRSKRSGAD